MEMAKSGGLLAVLSLTKAEQDLALTQGGQSCVMSRPPTAPTPVNRGKIQVISPGRYRWDTQAPTQLTRGAALCHSMNKIPNGAWERTASSCSHKAPGNSMPKREQLGSSPGGAARTRPILANRPFHGGATMLNKSCPCWPPALPAALPAWHRAKPLNKGGLEAEHTLTPWWISLDRPRRGASPTPARQSRAGSAGSTWHSPTRAAAVMGSLGAACTRGIPRTPLQLFSSDSQRLPATSWTRATAKPCQRDETAQRGFEGGGGENLMT